MTEDEAKTKWCPKAAPDQARCGNRCIASDCMWWVWDRAPEQYKNHLIEGGSDMPRAKPSGRCGAIK